MSSKGSQNITGYRYSMSILMGLCRGPIEQVVQIKVADIVAWSGPLIQGAVQIPIYQPQLFGGDEAEGGLSGGFDFYDGSAAQFLPATTKNIITSTNEIAVAYSDGSEVIPLPPVDDTAGSDTNQGAPTVGDPTIPINYVLEAVPVPELRGVACLWYDGQICSNNPYPKEWKIRVRRVLAGWDGDPWYPEAAVVPLQDSAALYTAATDTANVQADASTDEQGNGGYTTNTTPATTAQLLPESGSIYAMNPAHIIYEVITNRVWGRGLDRTLIDDASFSSAANWLLGEGFGMCLKWTKSDDLGTFIQHVLDCAGGVLFTSRLTGLLTLKLIRNDYNVSELMQMDYNSGLLTLNDVSNTSQDNLINEVIVKYNSPVSNTDRQVRAQNLASITTQDAVYSTTKDYPGIPTPDLAIRVAQRDLASVAWGVKTFELLCDRRAYKIQPGDCFSLVAPDRGIYGTILRLIKLEDSTLTDQTIKLTAAQDVFGLPLTSFTAPQQVIFNTPNKSPQPVSYHRLLEMTYRDCYTRLASADLAALTSATTSFLDFPAIPSTLSQGYDLNVSTDGGVTYTDNGLHAFPVLLRLVKAIGKYDGTVTFSGFSNNFGYSLPACFLIDDEMLRIDELDTYTGIATVARGCVDTLPQAHAAGAVVWLQDTGQTDTIEYAVGETITVKEQTRTSKGMLNLSLAPAISIVTAGRQARPYPPANVTVNGPYAIDGGGQWTLTAVDLTINFARRNRLTLGDLMVGFTDADMVPEVGQTTTVRIRRMADGVVVGTYPGIAGTQFVYTQAQALTDGAFGLIQIELFAVLGALTSKFVYAYPVNYYPAAAPITVTGQPAPRVGIQQCTLFLKAIQAGAGVVTPTMTSAFVLYSPHGQTGIVSNTGQGSGSLALTSVEAGTTLGGFASNTTIYLEATQVGSAPAIGQGFGSWVLKSLLGDTSDGVVSGFAMTARQYGVTGKVDISVGNFVLTGSGTGTLSAIAVGTMVGNFSFNTFSAGYGTVTDETGQDTVTGTASGNFALTGIEAGSISITGSSTAGMALKASEASSQIATCTSTGNFALTSVQAGTVPAIGSSTGNIQLTAADTGSVPATGSSTGNYALTSVEAGSAPATGSSTGNTALTSTEAGTSGGAGYGTGGYGTSGYGS